MVDFKPDGKFKITNGGITHGIKRELGLSDAECQELKNQSVWAQIINEFEGETNGQKNMIVTKNHKDTSNKSNNFLVHPKAVIEFSKDCWKRIVNLINKALNKNIQIEDTTGNNNIISQSSEIQTKNTELMPINQASQEKLQLAKNLVIENLSKLDLPDNMNKSKLQEALSRVQTKPLELPSRENLSVGDITNSLILGLLKEAYPEKDVITLKELAITNTIKLAPNETIANVNPSDFNEQFIGELARIDEVTPSKELKNDVEKAVNLIQNELAKLSEEELKTLGINSAKRDRILSYLSHIMYDSTGESAHAAGPWIVVSTQWKDLDNIPSMIALLMHEANHCDEDYYRYGNNTDNPNHNNYVNTWEEEKSCETLGMLTVGLLAKKGIIPDYSRYNNHSVQDYIDENGNPTQLLKDDINEWVQRYTNYPKDMNGNLTVRHMEENDPDHIVKLTADERKQSFDIKPGDIIKIGDKEYSIGTNDYLLSPIDSAPIFQIINKEGLVLSRIVFDKVPPNRTELDLIAKRYNNEDDKKLTEGNYITIKLISKDGTEYTGKCYDTNV